MIGFTIGLVLARLLSPADFGMIALLTVFLAVSESLIDSGFANALIQKKARTEEDYSTVFWFNLGAAILFYGVIYLGAPLVAKFYHVPELASVMRVLAIGIIVNAMANVPIARFTIALDFKAQAMASIAAVVAGGAVGIGMALKGWSYWALVGQALVGACVRLGVILALARWRPEIKFSVEAFKGLFSFGSKLVAAGIIHTIYANIHSLIIGRFFGATDLGYFNRGVQYVQMPGDLMGSVVMRVNYPILSELQDDREALIKTYGKLLRAPMMLLFPMVVGLAAVAEPLVTVLIGERWLPCSVYLQIMAFAYLWDPMTKINLNLLYVKGRSDEVLKLEFIKKSIAFVILFSTLPFGIIHFCFGSAAYSLIAFYLNCRATKRILDFGFVEQMKAVLPILGKCVIMAIVVRAVIGFTSVAWVQLLSGVVSGILVYGALNYKLLKK